MIIAQIVIYTIALIGLWLSSEMIIEGVQRFSKRLNISSFAISFFVLGILTSIPEFSIGVNSIISLEPEIFVGNLTGASFVIFLFLIPFLAIIGNGVKLETNLDNRDLLIALFVILAPSIFIIDSHINPIEGFFLILLYGVLFLVIQKRKGVVEKTIDVFTIKERGTIVDVGKIITGTIFIILSSNILVEKTLFIADLFNIPTLIISLFVLSFGSNLPELIIGIKSVLRSEKDVAFGDYVGSSGVNTLFFGVLLIVNGPAFISGDGFIARFALFAFGLVLFYIFAKSKNEISRKEGLIIISVYILVVIYEVLTTSSINPLLH